MKYISLTLLLAVPTLSLGMELVPQGEADLEQGRQLLHADLATAIHAGKLTRMHELLQHKQTRDGAAAPSSAPLTSDLAQLANLNPAELANTLGWTNTALASEAQNLAQGYLDNFWARYKGGAIPFLVFALAAGTLTVTSISLHDQLNSGQTLSSLLLGSDGLMIGQSVATLGASGTVMGKEIYAGVLDLDQKEKVDKLKNAQLLLQTLQAQAANSTGAAAAGLETAIAQQEVVVANDSASAGKVDAEAAQADAAAAAAEQQFDNSNPAAQALDADGLQAVGEQAAQEVQQGAAAAGNQQVAAIAQALGAGDVQAAAQQVAQEVQQDAAAAGNQQVAQVAQAVEQEVAK